MGNPATRDRVLQLSHAPMALLAAASLLALLAAGCRAGTDRTVRDRDRQRQETARTMPGNELPQDPADMGDRAPTDPALGQDSR